MNLQTKIKLEKQSKNLIDYNSNILLLGSCFSDNIGKKLEYYKFKNLQNPFGILFHPKAIETLLFRAINDKKYLNEDVFFYNERWHCFDAHSELSSTSKETLLLTLNTALENLKVELNEASHTIITLGTAWVYQFLKSEKSVANCHKISQKEFKKELLSVDAIQNALKASVDLIRKLNSETSIIFTVSPVRHLKDGFVENTLSKAHLISAIHEFLNKKSFIVNHYSSYFPSYEIMMDELRDYRFYTEDMIHPNQTAINYIWEQFQYAWISPEAQNTMNDVEVIQKGISHKPFNPNSEAHQQFLQKIEVKKALLSNQFSHIVF